MTALESKVAAYYTRALTAHGPSARGVDWSSLESQELRFRVLLEGIDFEASPALLDYGCGYGALAAYLDAHRLSCRYQGYDIAAPMLEQARLTIGERADRRFVASESELAEADHVLASGIFNVKLDIDASEWGRHVQCTLRKLWSLARVSLAFNMLPPPSAPELAREHLHYFSPSELAHFCSHDLDAAVSVTRDYGLWEFTVRALRRRRGVR